MTASIYDLSVPTSKGDEKSLEDYRGKVLLIVNTASKCGFTPQYEGLQALHEKHSESGLVVIAMPCNQFGKQEPGSNAEVQEFCQMNYGLSFPVMGKIDVNGPNRHPLYTYLTQQAGGVITDGIKWNFTKFLVDREGNVVKRFGSISKPADIGKDIEKLL
ncbi:glutathione peroxidase [bacterium]|nr:glutathione peroxidase [Porticoccaceae bacterium]MDB4000931.1 glutathione peroxidase [bacterium]MDB9953671.1 glutathione peroxidase [Porticoccaceae bacterium]MDB9999505.1 glutathione peroxidase [Porticoccaceae bacterium]